MEGRLREFTARVFPSDGLWVAQCLEIDVASQGKTPGEALDALREALELRFEDEELPADFPGTVRFAVAI